MAYNIIIDTEQQFSSVADPEPEVQDWSFSPESPLEKFYFQGQSTPADVDIDVTIKDYITDTFTDFDEYYIKSEIIGNDPQIISISGDIPSAEGDGYLLSLENLETTITVSFQNLSVFDNETIENKIVLSVYGKNTGLPAQGFQSVLFVVRMTFPDPETVFMWPTTLNFQHVLNESLPPTQNADLYADGNFSVFVPGHLVLTGGNLVDQGLTGDVREYTGSNDQMITIGLTSDINDEDVGLYSTFLGFVASSGIATYPPVTVNILQNSDVIITPTSLEFSAIKNISEAIAAQVQIITVDAFTLSYPAWLEVSVVGGQGVDNLFVQPISQVNLAAGTYEGEIVITIDGENYIVTVLHNVFENVLLGASKTNLNFTDDYDTISEFYDTADYRLKLNLIISYFSYGATTTNDSELPVKLGLFNNKATFFIGKSLRNIMKELLDLQSINLSVLSNQLPGDDVLFIRNYYNPSSVNLEVEFNHKFEELLDKTYTFENLKYIKGRKPEHAFSNTVLLNYYKEPLRVTPKSVALFNFYKEEPHTLRIFKNGELESQKSHLPGVQRLFAYRHTFESYTAGDVIEIRLHKNLDDLIDTLWYNDPQNYVSQKYIVFPEGKESYHIGWEDEYGVLSLMEFTGALTFGMDFDNNITRNYQSFLETLRKLDARKSHKVVCNTGYILKSNTKRIESLLNSKRAWIISTETTSPINLIPVTSTLSGNDSDRELYEYDIEFSINPNNDHKSYT